MSSHMFAFDELFYDNYQNTNSVMFTDESTDLPFLSDFNPLTLTASLSDSSIDSIILQELSDDHQNNNGATPHQQGNNPVSADEVQPLDNIAKTLLGNSPPSNQLESLSICQPDTHLVGNLASGYTGYSSVKTEESSGQGQMSLESSSYNDSSRYFLGGSSNGNSSSSCCYDGGDLGGMIGFLQRSYSSNSFDGKSDGFPFQPRCGSLIEQHAFPAVSGSTAAAAAASFQQVITNSPDSTALINGGAGKMRRVCSAGDLPKVRSGQTTEGGQQQQQRLSSSLLGTEGGGSFMEEGSFKVGRYSADERKERIDRYRAKRTQRNFNKTIKYACRKTLADNRPRIRGRFARNDDTGEIPVPKACTAANTATSTAPLSFIRHHSRRYEDEDDLPWVTELHDDEDERGGGRGRFPSNFGGMAQFQQYRHYYGY